MFVPFHTGRRRERDWTRERLESGSRSIVLTYTVSLCFLPRRTGCIVGFKQCRRHQHVVKGSGVIAFDSLCLLLMYLCLWPKWQPIPCIVHYLWPEPYGPRAKIVHCIGNRVPFGTHPLCEHSSTTTVPADTKNGENAFLSSAFRTPLHTFTTRKKSLTFIIRLIPNWGLNWQVIKWNDAENFTRAHGSAVISLQGADWY